MEDMLWNPPSTLHVYEQTVPIDLISDGVMVPTAGRTSAEEVGLSL